MPPAQLAPSPTRAVLEAAADPAAARMHPVTLRFASPVLESAFTTEYERASIQHIRIALAMGVTLVVAFGILDAILQGTVRRELWLIRYGVLTPAVVLVLALTFTRWALRYIEWILAVLVLVIGAGITAMILIAPPPGRYFYYAGLILVVMYDLTCLRLRFAVASVVACAVVALYIGVELFVGQTPWPILTNNLFFFVSATVIGMFAAYFLESLARRNFVQDKLVRRAREFGSYRLVAPLGGGGMGEVWRAEHQLLARPAAIKLIRPEVLGSTDALERRATLRRFEREAQATALLRSPHTIQLYDFGVTEEDTFYYVMELLEGYNLETLVRSFGPLPWARAVRLLKQVCHSLAEAHEQGLIHRDIKPANIFVCRYGRAVDFVKVLDFGLVKSQHARDSRDATVPTELTVTHRGGLSGTPSCMAPEQITGDRRLDGRTDLYGVGCVANWLLTGKHLFDATTAPEMMTHHLETPPAPPSTRTAQVLPPSLDAAVLACVEKDAERRPQTADALAHLLASCGDGAWSDERARSWWIEHAPQGAEAWTGEARVVMPTLVQPWRS